MSLWTPAPVNEEPEVDLHDWQAFRIKVAGLPDITLHLAGYVPRSGGRVTSPIQAVDVATRRVRTERGRVYVVVGRPGKSSDGTYVLARWLRMNEAEEVWDVTEEFNAQFERPA